MTPKPPAQPMEEDEDTFAVKSTTEYEPTRPVGAQPMELEPSLLKAELMAIQKQGTTHNPSHIVVDVNEVLSLLQSRLTAQAEAFEKLIGEDEYGGSVGFDDEYFIGRDNLRQELRQQLKRVREGQP
jgi:hypothetical protein